ncbi:MAG: iron response transcriptional regulator IrrA [Pseudomonadota bacterium]
MTAVSRVGLCGVRDALKVAGLRPTRQRLALGQLLFDGHGRHITAERLYEEALRAKIPVSLATVYNTLNQFTSAGLLREIALDGARTTYDTNTSHHHHFVDEDTNEVCDIPANAVQINALPEAPEGMEIARVDVVVRLRAKPN